MPELANNNATTLVLSLCQFGNVTPRLFSHLLQRYGSVESIIEATRESLAEIEGLDETAIDYIRSATDRICEAEAAQAGMAARGISLVSLFDEQYPLQLEELNDPPPILYVRGRMSDRSRKSVAIVGTHEASNDGMELTAQLVKRFVKADVQIISSLIGGIDTCAHLAAGSSGASSFALLEYGFDNLHGADLVTIAIDISKTGGIISEYPPEMDIEQSHMSATNRLIVGMADAVIATELSDNSERSLDLLDFCDQIGKLTFVLVDPRTENIQGKVALKRALSLGAIPVAGVDNVDDIVKSLV